MLSRFKARFRGKGHQRQTSSSASMVGPSSQNGSKMSIVEVERRGDKQSPTVVAVAPAVNEHLGDDSSATSIAASQNTNNIIAPSSSTEPVAPSPKDESAVNTPIPNIIVNPPTNTAPIYSSSSPETSLAPKPPRDKSLWDRAYDALESNNEKLVADYKDLLDREAKSISADKSPTSSRPSKAQLDAIIKKGLQRAEEKKTKYTIAGHEFDLSNQVSQAADILLWAKDWIGDAVSVSPQASAAWAGVCLILPFLTAPHTAKKANKIGFTYVTTRIRFYTSLEPLLESSHPTKAMTEIKESLVDLYEKILSFQFESILHIYKSRLESYVSAIALPNYWKEKQNEIKDLEAIINEDLSRASELISTQELENLNKICKNNHGKLESLLSVAQEHLDVSKAHLESSRDQLTATQELRDLARKQEQLQQKEARERRSDKENKCHQLFRLTSEDKDVTYEAFKGLVEPRVENTCKWFLQHADFQNWLSSKSSPLLVSADPGCGKSVLAKYLVDHELPTNSSPDTAICYFFFKEQVQNTVRQALCALIHQLFDKKPALVEHAMAHFKTDGEKLINSNATLWKVFTKSVHDRRTGPVTIVLDALDECAEFDFGNLMRNLRDQFRSENTQGSQLKVIMTSRPYHQILSEFRSLLESFPRLHIPGEEKLEDIGEEVNLVVRHRAGQLAKDKGLSEELACVLKTELLKFQHRTYLWVHLVFENLKAQTLKKTKKGIEDAVATLPKTVNDAYESILAKTDSDAKVRRVLAAVLAAERPLTLSEMNIIVNFSCDLTSPGTVKDLDLEEEEDFKARLRSLCGLFITVFNKCIYFIHLTAREFLLRPKNSAIPPTMPVVKWQHSFTMQEAHKILAETCITYLNCFTPVPKSPMEIDGDPRESLLTYAVKHWPYHFRIADVRSDEAITSMAVGLYDTNGGTESAVIRRILNNKGVCYVLGGIWAACYFGHTASTKLMLQRGAEVDARYQKSRLTPLLVAISKNHQAVVRLLLAAKATVNPTDSIDRHPLDFAVCSQKHPGIVKDLLEAGAHANAYGQSALLSATDLYDCAMAKLLLDYGANVNVAQKTGLTPLHVAAGNGCSEIVSLYIQAGADVNAEDKIGDTALCRAASHWNGALVCQMLLDAGANVNHRKRDGQRPLHMGVQFEEVLRVLLDAGAVVEPVDLTGSDVDITPLMSAASKDNAICVQMLLDAGADIHRADKDGKSVLSYGIFSHEITRILLDAGARVNSIDNSGWSPLFFAVDGIYEASARLLIDTGANVHIVDVNGRTALMHAAMAGSEELVGLLVNVGADINFVDNEGRTSLMYAAETGNKKAVSLLIDIGADINFGDNRGRTALSYAAFSNCTKTTSLLVDAGADINAVDADGTSVLIYAVLERHTAVLSFLLDAGANVDIMDIEGRSALSYAAVYADEESLRLLIEAGADVDTLDIDGQTALWHAAACRGKENVLRLLITAGANVNTSNKVGVTVLMCAAAQYGQLSTQLLIDAGANVDVMDAKGRAALWHAAVNRRAENNLPLLIEAGADVNATDEDGTSVLMHAVTNTSVYTAAKKQEEVVRMLLQAGANVYHTRKDGQTVLDRVQHNVKRELVPVIEKLVREKIASSPRSSEE